MKLHIKNFRSIKQLDLELAPITVLYGHNGTGKSSALYAPLTLKNIVLNPERRNWAFFNYEFARLGEFQEVVTDHNQNYELELGISLPTPHPVLDELSGLESEYVVSLLSNGTGTFRYRVFHQGDMLANLAMEVSFPYSGEGYQSYRGVVTVDAFMWNGIDFTSEHDEALLGHSQRATLELLRYPVAELRRVSFVPLGRGFFHPLYSLQEVSPMIATEQEVTSMLAGDEYLEYRIGRYMEKILGRDFRIRSRIGSKNFSLNSIDRQTGVGASLVNEGFGVNQLVYMLAKVLHSDAGIVCIEEPEIHLHPTAIRRLARTLADIVHEEPDKRLIISTHSEQFIMSFLALVAEGTYSAEKLAIYHVTKEGKESEFHRQQVNDNGQVEGGLATFMEGELEDMKAFLGV